MNQVRRYTHPCSTLTDQFTHAFEISVLKVSKSSMDNLQAVGGSGRSEVSFFNEADAEAAMHSLPCDARTVNASTDDHEIVKAVCQILQLSLHQCVSGTRRAWPFLRSRTISTSN